MLNIIYKSIYINKKDKNIRQISYRTGLSNLLIKQVVHRTDTTLNVFYHDVFTTIFRQTGITFTPYFYADGTNVKEFTYTLPWAYTDPGVLAIRLGRGAVSNDDITRTITFGKYSLRYNSSDNGISFTLLDNTKPDGTEIIWHQRLGIVLPTDPIALRDQFVIKCYKSSQGTRGFLDTLLIQFYNQNGTEATLKYTIECPLILTELFGKTLEGNAGGTYISALI